MKRRILVIGAGNFVGSKVRQALAASQWAEPVPLSATPAAVSPEHLEGIDAVFNGAMGSPDAIAEQARTLYAAVEKSGARVRVVHLSSMTVYGSYTGEAVETTPLRSDLGAYGAAQIAAESLAARYAHTVILRPGCEYGPGCPQWSERIARLVRSRRLGDLGADGDGRCNLIFAGDLIAVIIEALRIPGLDGNCFNLAMASPPTWNEYFSLFARALGAVPVARIGSRRLKIEVRLAAPPLKILEMVGSRIMPGAFALPPPITPSLLNLCAQNITLNCRKAELAFGLAWTPLSEGLRQAAAALEQRRPPPV